MIEYANELIEEIKAQKPSSATTITAMGCPIKDVRYDGIGLVIRCDTTDFVTKDEYDAVKDDYEYARGEVDDFSNRVEELEGCLRNIRDMIDNKKEWDSFTDEIHELIEEKL